LNRTCFRASHFSNEREQAHEKAIFEVRASRSTFLQTTPTIREAFNRGYAGYRWEIAIGVLKHFTPRSRAAVAAYLGRKSDKACGSAMARARTRKQRGAWNRFYARSCRFLIIPHFSTDHCVRVDGKIGSLR